MATLYLDIKNDLLQKIQDGTYKEGHLIPNEIELAQYYGVSRPTIRQAIQPLVEQGLLERKKRRGTIVSYKKINQAFTQDIASFDSQIRAEGSKTKTIVVTFQKEEASKEVFEVLQSKIVFKLVRLRYIDDIPNVYVITYFPYPLLKDLEKIDFQTNSFYDACTKYSHPITTIQRELEIVLADETLADLLQIEENSPLFYFHSKGFDQNGTPIEYSLSKYRSDTSKFKFQLQKRIL